MRISRTIAYAIHATLQLARESSNTPIPCSELARAGRLPERFLLRILRALVTHGILQSTRGVDGGYQLSRPPEEITLRDIVEAFENPLEAAFPAEVGMSPPARSRILRTLLDVAGVARAELAALSLADLLQAEATNLENGRSAGLRHPVFAVAATSAVLKPPAIQ